MKIYQLIYTSALHSLSDSSKGLSNQAGMCVYSCSEGITKDNISEITRFVSYRIPKYSTVAYSKTPCDATVPELFPKSFRTLRLSDGRYAAIQVVYSGYDFDGNKGNYFAHALVFDEFDDAFFPEKFYSSPLFRTSLSEKEQSSELVKYLGEAEDKRNTNLDREVTEFINEHRRELNYLIKRSFDLLTDKKMRNICISTSEPHLTDMYLVALKYLLPRDVSRHTGISTYDVYMPSEKQFNIVFHGTVKDMNNISRESVETNSSCIYIDMENTDFGDDEILCVFDKDLLSLRELYKECKFVSVTGFIDWCESYKGETQTGLGGRLLRLQKSAGDRALRSRLNELYSHANEIRFRGVKFEILKLLYDNSEKLPSKEKDITIDFFTHCIEMMCGGVDFDLVDVADSLTEEKAKTVVGNIRLYMAKILDAYDTLSEFNKKSFTEFFGVLKHTIRKETWRDFFLNDTQMLKTFVTMSAEHSIVGRGIEMFAVPKMWDNADLSELVAYIDSSTDDEIIKQGCLKYILTYPDENWSAYGITIEKKSKTKDEEEEDLKRVKRMLLKIGYLPFERATYEHLKTDVRADISDNLNPLLLSKLLNAYYNWKSASGNQHKAKKRAKALKKLILELRDKERDVYNFIFPKLAIEIVETRSHYHELIINADTMPKSFWNWLAIGAMRIKSDDNKILNYSRIYMANREVFNRNVSTHLIRVFEEVR